MLAQPKPTIEQYADCLSECVMKELTETLSPIIFVPEKNVGFKRELDLRLQSHLLSNGIAVRESPSEEAQNLQYDIQSATVSVEEMNGQWLRKVSLAVFVKQQRGGELKRAKLVAAERIDSLSRSDLERLSDTRYPETTIAQPRTWLDKAIVPTLTTLSLGIIVYLFFSVRSN
ncbi:MAG: hypothetical protein SNJ55_10000 [Chloroherpetonaceae bacterium]